MKGDAGRWREARVACECEKGNGETGKIVTISDNQGAIFLSSNEASDKCTKHIDTRYHHIRGAVEDKQIKIYFAPTIDQPADLLTKNLGRVKFEKFRQAMGLRFHNTK